MAPPCRPAPDPPEPGPRVASHTRPGDAAPDGALAESRASFADALAQGNAAGAAAVFAEDARVLVASSEFTIGRDAIAAFWQAGLDAGLAGVELEMTTLDHCDAVAYETGRYSLHLVPPEGGGPVAERGSYVLVHRRQSDGTWRWAVEMLSPDPG